MVTDDSAATPGEGSSTPAGEPKDDFFSSWDKPTIKRPSNPPSRTGTPPVVSRTASPFLSAGGANGAAGRPKSPLSAGNDGETPLAAPTAIRTTTSSAIRKNATTTAAKRTNILGAKKTQKLGAKKVVGEEIDFDAAEKAAKAEAERIAKLGYDPEAEKSQETSKSRSTTVAAADSSIVSPTPISPPKGGYGSSNTQHQRSPSEVERLGMGVQRLGFGQVGSNKAGANTAPAPKKLGFGSIGATKPAEGMSLMILICSTINTNVSR